MAEEKVATTNPNMAESPQIKDAEAQKTGTNQSVAKKEPVNAKIREKRAFTATIVTFALVALLIFMVVWTMVTGSEDKNGIVAGAMVIATSAIQFYFGTKQGGTNA